MLHPDFAAAGFARARERALCFVPDFRIGNRSLRDPAPVESYLGVAKELISDENDRRMFDAVMDRVRSIRDSNPDARFVFWCLGGRELLNREQGRYMEGGKYRHPVWNLAEVEAEIGESVVSLQGMVQHPLGRMLHIDGSAHPSQVGLELFRRMTDDPESSATAHLDSMMRDLQRPVITVPPGAVITGDSFWLEALRLYVNRGIVVLGDGVRIRTPEQLLAGSEAEVALYVSGLRLIPEAGAADRIDAAAASLKALEAGGYRTRVLLWESRAAGVLNPRVQMPASDPRSTTSAHRVLAERSVKAHFVSEEPGDSGFVRPRDVEVSHPRGPMPTLDGLLTVIRLLGGDHRWEPVR